MKKQLLHALVLSMVSMPIYAAQNQNKPLINKGDLSIGAGIGFNSVDTPFGDIDETGIQFFGAYHLRNFNLAHGVNTSIEAGYMDYGFSQGNSGGLWVNAVIDGDIQGNIGWLARAGLDLGDDDGIMLGGGVSFGLAAGTDLRVEYVLRDNIDSLQFNLIHRL